MEALIKEQKKAISELQKIIRNFGKDSKDLKAKPEYFSRRINRLDAWWIAFEARHKSLKASPEQQQPYFSENVFVSTKNLYHNHRQTLQDGLTKVAPAGFSFSTELNDELDEENIDEIDDEDLNAMLDATLKDFMSKPSTSKANSTITSDVIIDETDKNLNNPVTIDSTNTDAQILKILYIDICALINSAEELNMDTRRGQVQAELELLRETWSNLRTHYYRVRGMNHPASNEVNMNVLQKEYTKAIGYLNELSTSEKDNSSLPKLKIPEFNGNPKEWRTFIDLFNKIVHERNIPVSHKMEYLKASLRGTAAGLVAHLNAADEYDACLKILYKRYDNKRKLLGNYFDNILNLAPHNGESSGELRKLHDVTTETMIAINNLGVDTSTWDSLVSHILIKKLSEETIKHYECQLKDVREPTSLGEFLTYIENRYLAIQSVESNDVVKNMKIKKNNKEFEKKKSNEKNYNCVLCDAPHHLRVCQRFLNGDAAERLKIVKSKNLCVNCLSANHSKASDCKSKFNCKTCQKKHHSLLHLETVKTNVAKVSVKECDENDTTISANTTAVNTKVNQQVLLATALVCVRGTNGENYALRALIDQGSQSSFISEGALQLTKLPKLKERNRVCGITRENEMCMYVVDLQIMPRFTSSFMLQTRAIVMKSLVNLTKNALQITNPFNHLNNLHLADPSYRESGQIDILLGAAEYAKMIKSGLIKGAIDEPIAQNSEFGWIISGPTNAQKSFGATVTTLVSITDVENQISEFFKHDDIKFEEESLSEEETMCEKHFTENTTRLETGKFSVKMPFKGGKEFPALGDSRKIAIATMLQLEKRFQKNHQLAEQYKQFIHEYINLGHMELSVYDPTVPSYYLPHHCVLRESTTTKLRVVFNASQKTDNGLSLNDELALGTIEQNDIISILLNFRLYKYAFTSDVEKMYRQIMIDESQRNLQKIVWRDSPNMPISEYRLKTITYGTANAPYLAIRTLKQLAIECESNYPNISHIIRKNMYVDDVVSGAFTESEAIQKYRDLREVFNNAGFNLRKWSSNSENLLSAIPTVDREMKGVSSNVKALGIAWSPTEDIFTYELKLQNHTKPFTKRLLLSEISSLFDPLGWICPVVIAAKNLVQELWKTNVDWDETVPNTISEKWLKIKRELHMINDIKIARYIDYNPNDVMELHGFADASELAFAAVIYVKNVTKNTVRLLCAKNRVAPLKTSKDALTIPRLELCAANLLAKLTKGVLKALEINFNKMFFWSDSKIVIDWLRGNPKRYKKFIAHRICTVDKYVGTKNWFHVSSERNAADCASRGILPSELVNHRMWWNGPEFLHGNDYSMASDMTHSDQLIETLALNANVSREIFNLPDVSSFCKLKNIIAYCLRFIASCKNKQKYAGPISVNEIQLAETAIIRIVQNETFSEEVNELMNDKSIKKTSNILKLSPFLDERGVIRVGGRLRNAVLSFERKHPILLPKNHRVTTLIIRSYHVLCLHGGPRATETVIRQRFWLLNSQTEIKKVLRQCIPCFKQKQNTMSQFMADLPASRVNVAEKPFTYVAVDYTGAINYKLAKGRAGKIAKAYICIFVCMTVKAMHIELVSDMTADAFIAAVRRLIARRGMVREFRSDNGTNFVGANRDLQNLHEIQKEEFETIKSELAREGITWKFSPAGAPHFNGLAEAAVKVVKRQLIKTIGQTTLTFEELATLLYQIEACANSRPLCPLSSDPNDMDCLTPGHFLVGRPLLAPPDESFIETNTNWLSRWQLVQKLNQIIWKRFQAEYINELQTKSKWFTKNKEPNVNDLVLVREENSPPCKWPLARITDVHKGSDGLTRVVTIKMRNNTFKRPVTKLAPLPIENDSNKIEARAPLKKQTFNVIPIITALLAIFVTGAHTSTNEVTPFRSNVFETSPGLYFEKIKVARFSYTNWNSIVYVNLNSIFEDAAMIRRNFQDIQDVCKRKLSGHGSCNSLSQLIEHRLNDIDDRNELILTFKHHRNKRAVLDIIGNIARDLFGVLDSRFARQYVMDIEKLEANDEHVLALLKNHTSILNSTMNIIKKDQNEIEMQREHIMTLASLTKSQSNEQQASMYFHTMTTYTLHLISDYERQQDSLLEVLTGARKNHIDHNLLSPSQVKKQMSLMSEHLSETLTPPDEADFYKIATINPFITNDTLFFRISIPLLNDEKYQVYQIYQVPFIKNEEVYAIKLNYDMIIAALDRQKYQLITKGHLLDCKSYRQDMAICFAPRKWLTSQVTTCVWNLFSHKSSESCELIHASSHDKWIELDEPNKWIYFVHPSTKLISVCNDHVQHHKLSGAGTLQLNPECILRGDDYEIIPKNDIRGEPNEFIIPNLVMNISSFKPIGWEETTSLTKRTNGLNITELQLRLQTVETKSRLPNKLNNHDIHHYTLIYFILAIVCLSSLVVIHVLKTVRVMKLSRPKSISMPNLTEDLARGRAQRLSAPENV